MPAKKMETSQKKQTTQRKSKTNVENVSTDVNHTNLTVNEVEDRWKKVFNSNGFGGGLGNFYLNTGAMFINDPYLLNQRIKQLKTLPEFLDRERIEQALLQPEYNELSLRTATHSMLYLTYPLYRLQMLYEGILSYRSYIQPTYVSKEDMDKPRFQSDWKFVDMWHKKLNPQKQFRRIVAEVMPEGKRAYYLRQSYNTTSGKENVDYVMFQDLPSDWYKIIKHSTDSYQVVAFNFAYFWMAGTSLGQFPPIFAKYYQELMNATSVLPSGQKIINQDLTPEDVVVEYNSESMQWFYWKELPSDECFMFSFTESDDIQISPFSSLLLQAQDLSSYSLLQQQLLSVPLYSMLLGEIPIHGGDENKSGSHIDDYKISPDAVTMFENKVNSGMPPGTTYAMVPSTKNILHHFEAVPNANEIYDKGLQQMINTSGTSTLLTTTNRPSVAQVAAGKIIETRFIDRMYEQFAWAVNIILNKMFNNGDLKFKWFFRIFGDVFSEEKTISAVEKSLSLGQAELLPEFLAYHNMSLMDAVTNIDWVESTKIYEKFKPLINTFGMGSKESGNSGGRPKIPESEITNENTAASIDNGTNLQENR